MRNVALLNNTKLQNLQTPGYIWGREDSETVYLQINLDGIPYNKLDALGAEAIPYVSSDTSISYF